MSLEKILNVTKRDGLGKGHNRRLRAQKMVPGVFYSTNGDNIAVQIPYLPLEKMYGNVGRTTIFTLEIDDAGTKVSHPVMLWDVQYHPYKNTFSHVDFYGVDLDKAIKVSVAIEFIGTSKGVKLGGRLETYRDRITLISKPADMPKKITIDVTDMGLNAAIRAEDLVLPEGVRAVYDQNFAIVSVVSKVKEEDADSEDAGK